MEQTKHAWSGRERPPLESPSRAALSGSATFGGAPIVGVASLSKDRTIREFDHKKKYDEWQFVYDPTFDRGFLDHDSVPASLQRFGAQGTRI